MPLKRSRSSAVILLAAQMPLERNSAAWLRVALNKNLTHYLSSYTIYASNVTWGLVAACLGCA
eukprot:6008960-Pleurochrysis_carterae.AAC.1